MATYYQYEHQSETIEPWGSRNLSIFLNVILAFYATNSRFLYFCPRSSDKTWTI